MRIEIPLDTLAQPTEEELIHIILASADRFPGLYRISTGFKETFDSPNFMKWMNFFQTSYLSQTQKKFWTRSEWFQAHDQIFEIGFGEGSRNEERQEEDLKKILRDKYHQWYTQASSYRIAVIDNITPIEHIEVNTTYYMMGSLIHFGSDRLHIGWDQFSQTAYSSFTYDFTRIQKYIHSIYSSDALKDLFFKADCVAHLDFDTQQIGKLSFDLKSIEMSFHNFHPQSIVLASAKYDKPLPIQYAKPMGVSNVCA